MDTSDFPLKLKYKDRATEQVNEFKSLESWNNYNGEIANKIKRRIRQATSALTGRNQSDAVKNTLCN